MLKKIIQILCVFILLGGGYILYKQPSLRDNSLLFIKSLIPNLPSVKGISTKKADDITKELKKEADANINQLQKQMLEVRVSDVLVFLSRGQKIASDFRSLQDYLKGQVANIGKKK